MKINAFWSEPITLKRCKPGGLIYELATENLPNEPAVYIFARTYSSKTVPIYIGETQALRSRIRSHLRSLPLMRAIENAPAGRKVLIFCTLQTKSADFAKKQIGIIERALIAHAQTEGVTLFNKQGTKVPSDSISFTGNRTSESLAPRVLYVKRNLTAKGKKPRGGK